MMMSARWRGLLAWLALGMSCAARSSAQEPRSIQLRPQLGVGVHSRTFKRPIDTGTQTLTAAAVPAIEVGLGVTVWPETDFSLTVSVSYQTGLWLTVTELPPFALANEVSVRSQRLALSIAPSWRIAAQTRIGFALGATIRSFWPTDHALQTPSYSLVGPHARVELATALAGPLRLRIVPELQWVMLIERHALGIAAQGAAVGGEIALELAWGTRTIALTYRESRALLMRAARFEDVERYLTLRIEEAF